MKKFVVLSTIVMFYAHASHAVVSFNGSYSQNFDSLGTSGTAWVNDSTITGWSLFRGPSNAPVAISSILTGSGSVNTGSFYNFGTTNASDRAIGGSGAGGAYFGSPSSGAVAGFITVALQNISGTTYESFAVSYTGEQWRDGGAATPVAQTMVFEYGFGSTFTAVSTWATAGSGFNFSSPVFLNTGSGAAVDGNVAGQVTGIGGTVSSLSWNNGDTLWLRWIERNDAGNDHALALDGFSFTATAVPEPSSVALAAAGGFAFLFAFRRRR